jgi:transcriptional regulator with XRE-family HTH domain
VNIKSSLVGELKDPQYRRAFVASQIRIGIPFQIRALRKARGMTQPQLAEAAGMSQPRISEIETPGSRSLNLETLLRIADAFDIALEVRFLAFGEFIERSEKINPDSIAIEPFEDEIANEEYLERILGNERSEPSEIEEALKGHMGNGNLHAVPSYREQFIPPTGANAATVAEDYYEAISGGSRQSLSVL